MLGQADEPAETLVELVKVTPASTQPVVQPKPTKVCTEEPVKAPQKGKTLSAKEKKAQAKAEAAKGKATKGKTGKEKAAPVKTKTVCKVIPAKPLPKAKPPLPGSSRIVLQFAPEAAGRDIPYRWFTLPNPNRVVVDFGEVSFKTPLSLVKIPDGSLVQAMRAGSFRPGTVRMVLDLPKPTKVAVFGIPGKKAGKGSSATGPRLVIDVLGVRKGEQPTVVLPPADVVQAGRAPVIKPKPVVPAQPERAFEESAMSNSEPQSPPLAPDDVQPMKDITEAHGGRALVVLDAGHGGVDPGACGKTLHLCEKNLTLDMVKRVRGYLRSDTIDVILTRDTDVFIPLPDRPRVAQKNNADLFVSLHADMHPTNRTVKGATVYMVSEKASDREAARLMQSENDRDVMAGVALADESPEVQSILMSLVQRDTLNNSIYLGKTVLGQLGSFTEVRKTSLMSAGFRVLKSPDVPSILVEMGYLSNDKEERQLADDDYRDDLAKTIAKGIKAYVNAHVHYEKYSH